jgi:hypothetical protein
LDSPLNRAIEIGLNSLKENPFNLPDFEVRPAKLLPRSLPQ